MVLSNSLTLALLVFSLAMPFVVVGYTSYVLLVYPAEVVLGVLAFVYLFYALLAALMYVEYWLLYSERNVNVQSVEKMKTHVRIAYKILRPSGRDYGIAAVPFNAHSKINGLRGWCIPAQGKDYEVKEKDSLEESFPKVDGSELISDLKVKVLHIPAPDPGNIIGYEYELEEQPLVLQDTWYFQGSNPARESRYSVQLPPGWEYRASWLNYAEVKPTQAGNNLWQWSVSDIKGLREEDEMPPMRGLSGQLILSFFPPGGNAAKAFGNWKDMGVWYRNLTSGRLDASERCSKE